MQTQIAPEAVVTRRSVAGDLLGLLTITVYAVSFFLPVTRDVLGYQAFVCSLVFMVLIPMWAANLALWLGLAELSLGRYRRAGLAGLVALVLAASESWLFVGELQVGFFAWVGSMAMRIRSRVDGDKRTAGHRAVNATGAGFAVEWPKDGAAAGR